jgi:hypothetical protein
MERITQAHLEGVLKRINRTAGFGDNPKYSTIGAYCLDYAYGGVRLAQWVSEGGGERDITCGFGTKRETYYNMLAYCNGLEDQKARA